MKIIKGDVEIKTSADTKLLDGVIKITGGLDVQAGGTLSAPVLRSVGGEPYKQEKMK